MYAGIWLTTHDIACMFATNSRFHDDEIKRLLSLSFEGLVLKLKTEDEIVCITQILWMVIAWHTMHDFISMSTGDALGVKELILLAVQIGILLIYALDLCKYLFKCKA